MHTEYLLIKFYPTSYTRMDKPLLLEDREYDPITACARTTWTFYEEQRRNLKFVDKLEFENHIYSLSQLSSLLKKAAWEPVASYGNMATLQPISPLTALNIAAEAI